MSSSIPGAVTVLSSTVLRLATYVFLRWVCLSLAPILGSLGRSLINL
jgi:alkaline phosphatase D